MNGMILGAYEQAWRRSGSPDRPEEYPAETVQATAGEQPKSRRNVGDLIGFAAMAVALFFVGASYA